MGTERIPNDVIYEKRFAVTEQMAAKGIGLDVNVLSTPSLVLAIELTAHESISDYLNDGETTVGGGICIRHLNPTRVGENFEVVVRIKSMDKSRVTFIVEAFDTHAKIADGEHTRFIVDKERFRSRLVNK